MSSDIENRIERLEAMLLVGTPAYLCIYFDETGYYDVSGNRIDLDAAPAASVRLILPKKQLDAPTA